MIFTLLLACNSSTEAIDLLIQNAQVVLSPQDIRTSIGIHKGRFVEVDEDTVAIQTLNYQNRVLMPSFHDSHTHMLAGSFVFDKLLLVGVSSMGNIQSKLAGYVNDAPEVPWVVGYGWVASMMDDPKGTDLDAFSGDYPVALFDSAGHTLLVNSRALELAGINADTPDPEGGWIGRDENGHPTGLLKESAIELVSPLMVSQFTDAELSANFLDTVADFHAGGVTSISEILAVPGVNLTKPELLHQFADLQLRIQYYLPIFSEEDLPTLELYVDDQSEWVRFAGGKVWVDGSTGSGEAWSLAASDIDPEHHGSHYFDSATLQPIIAHAEAHGYPLKMHVNGDAAISAALDALEAIEAQNGELRQQYIFDHVVLVDDADYGRMQRLGIIASVQPSHALVGQYGDQADHWGDRMDTAWNFPELEAQGIPLVLGTDWPVWPTPHGIVNYWTATQNATRAIQNQSAFKGYTELGWKATGAAPEVGAFKAGYWADFIVLSALPFGDTPGSDIVIQETWVAGERVY